ncbi:MAG: hypothetical protein AB7F74_22730 [Parvibaculaceae bacterium]
MADFSTSTTTPEILASRASACAFRIVIVVRDRLEFEDAIEALIAKLDEIDPDPVLEPSLGVNGHLRKSVEAVDNEGDGADDEAELGWTELEAKSGRYSWEADPSEPSLGSLDNMTNQLRWSHGGTQDLEDEHDGAEPDDEWEDEREPEESCFADDGYPGPIFGDGVTIGTGPRRDHSKIPVRQLEEVSRG